MPLDNDARGWLLTCISGVACMVGATFICVDVVVRLFPSQRNFSIEHSDGFLSCSLSLTAGVMLFSTLYQMLPSSRSYLESAGYSPKAAAWILIACFLGGALGIQLFSNIVHRFMPSHAVGCDHSHGEEDEDVEAKATSTQVGQAHANGHLSPQEDEDHAESDNCCKQDNHDNEETPLLSRSQTHSPVRRDVLDRRCTSPDIARSAAPNLHHQPHDVPRPSLQTRVTSTVTQLLPGGASNAGCDDNGPCFGYTDPCGLNCFKNATSKVGPFRRWASSTVRYAPPLRTSKSTMTGAVDGASAAKQPPLQPLIERSNMTPETLSSVLIPSRKSSRNQLSDHESYGATDHDHDHDHNHDQEHDHTASEAPEHHHHHVPKNAFLSLSLQTSLAISLHKLPEGFITYATNHANPSLGLSVFLALAIHNTTEGFALALPIYLASQSRLRALISSFFLGALSQPLGAGVAALWLAIAEKERDGKNVDGIGEGVYGAMFALTAGVMASVGINLLGESFGLSHSKGMCLFFVVVGMGVLGFGAALTA